MKKITNKVLITEEIYNRVKIITELKKLSPLFIEAAQKIYDAWYQDEDGYDEMYGSGGICDDIASEISTIISRHTGYGSFTHYDEYDYHTSCYVYVCNDIVDEDDERGYLINVDIPFYNYEEGGGYTFKKIKGVTFTEDMVEIRDMSGFFNEYIGDDCEVIGD